MKNFIVALLGSKKFVAMLVGIVVTLLAKFKLNADPQTVAELVGLVVAYILGQGIADNGKAAAQVAAISVVSGGSPSQKVDAIKSV